jgi:hypothetical protein
VRFQDPGSTQTLREGLAEFRCALSEEDRQDEEQSRDLLCHDACHVVFGLGTSTSDDAVVDTWIVLGTDVDVRSYLQALWSSRALGKLIEREGIASVAWGILRAVPRAAVAAHRARRMRRKWSWAVAEHQMDRPLDEIRAEYGIRPL